MLFYISVSLWGAGGVGSVGGFLLLPEKQNKTKQINQNSKHRKVTLLFPFLPKSRL